MKQIKKLMVLVLMFTVASCGGGHGGDDDDPDIDAPPDVVDAPPDAPKSYAPCEGCCDPINQTGCAAGQACYHRLSGGGTPSFCDTVGTAKNGEQCFVNTDCAAGTGCLNNVCAKFCVSDADCTLPTADNCFPAQDPFIYGMCSPS